MNEVTHYRASRRPPVGRTQRGPRSHLFIFCSEQVRSCCDDLDCGLNQMRAYSQGTCEKIARGATGNLAFCLLRYSRQTQPSHALWT
jgi:hypothetical protein